MQDREKILVSGFDMAQKFVHVNKLLMFGTMTYSGVGCTEEFWFPSRTRTLISYSAYTQITKFTSNMSGGAVRQKDLVVLEMMNWMCGG
jgi:hypothetical protein